VPALASGNNAGDRGSNLGFESCSLPAGSHFDLTIRYSDDRLCEVVVCRPMASLPLDQRTPSQPSLDPECRVRQFPVSEKEIASPRSDDEKRAPFLPAYRALLLLLHEPIDKSSAWGKKTLSLRQYYLPPRRRDGARSLALPEGFADRNVKFGSLGSLELRR
jgi:hypothetical protein